MFNNAIILPLAAFAVIAGAPGPDTKSCPGDVILSPYAVPLAAEAIVPWLSSKTAGGPEGFAALKQMPPLARLRTPAQVGASAMQKNSDASDKTAPLEATVWLGMDADGLYLRVSVIDTNAYNVQTGSSIWDGDAIQLSFDPTALASPLLGDDADILPAGALFATLAQTSQGPSAWAHLRGGGRPTGPMHLPLTIERDEALCQTLYQVFVPFAELGTAAGLMPHLGFGLQINDKNPKQPHATHLIWGGGPSGTFRPGRLHRLAHAPLPPKYLAIGMTRSSLWQDGDFAEAVLVSSVPGPLDVEVSWGHRRHRFRLPSDIDIQPEDQDATPSAATRRWRLQAFSPPACERAQKLKVTVSDMRGHVRQRLDDSVVCLGPHLTALRDALRASAGDTQISALQQRIRHSQASLLDQAWAQARTLLPENPQAHDEVLAAAQTITHSRLGKAAEWRAYEGGQRALTLSFVASQDNSLQPYGLQLPKRWTPDRPQPVVVFLHGKGDARMTQFLADLESGEGPALDDAYLLLPWGRGIMGYQNLAEADVLEALASAGKSFAFDANRTYLAGFSMGGAGAWNLALHHPEPWAAVAIISGGTWLTSLGHGLGGNARDLPIGVWHGDADGTVDVQEALAMQEEMQTSNGHLSLNIIKGGGHAFDAHLRQKVFGWLLQHVRQPCDDFTYVVDDFTHRQRRGVRLRRQTAVMSYPSFSVHADGDMLYIKSTGTTGLDVDLGPKGLKRPGTTHVVWNGMPVYDGPPTQIVLGTGAGR